VISRLDFYPVLRALDTDYVADAVPVLMICLGLAFLPLAGGQHDITPAPSRRRLSAVGEQRARSAAAASVGIFVISSVWSVQAYESDTSGASASSFVANAVAAVRQAPAGTVVADTGVPLDISFEPYGGRASRVLGDIAPGNLRWIAQPQGTINDLEIFGADGRLHPAYVYGAASLPLPSGRSCWQARKGQITMRFWRAAPTATSELRIGYLYYPQVPATVEVIYNSVVTELTLRHGLNAAYVPVTGSAESVIIAGISGRVCFGDAEAGLVEPVHGP
jgi:hypothetical protein